MIAIRRRVAALTGLRRLALAAAAGAASALAQPPLSWPIVLFLAMPLLLWLLDGTAGPRAAFAVGWAAGAGHFAAALFWIVEPFLVQPEIFGWMAPFALVGMAGGLALFWAVPFALARAWWPPGVWRVFVLASFWIRLWQCQIRPEHPCSDPASSGPRLRCSYSAPVSPCASSGSQWDCGACAGSCAAR